MNASIPYQAFELVKNKVRKNYLVFFPQADATSNMSIKNLLRERGHGLEALYLAGNKSVGTPSLAAVQVRRNNSWWNNVITIDWVIVIYK